MFQAVKVVNSFAVGAPTYGAKPRDFLSKLLQVFVASGVDALAASMKPLSAAVAGHAFCSPTDSAVTSTTEPRGTVACSLTGYMVLGSRIWLWGI